jgi:hypothetical protein
MTDEQTEVQALKDKMWQRSYYVMFRTVIDPSLIPDVMLEHYKWMIAMEKQNKVFASGPLFDKSNKKGVGMSVLRADSWEEAEQLARGDPFVTSGAMEFSIQRWQVNEGRINVSIDFSDQTYLAS